MHGNFRSQCRSHASACSNPVQQSPSMRLFYSVLLVWFASFWLFNACLLLFLMLERCSDRSQISKHKITVWKWIYWTEQGFGLLSQLCCVYRYAWCGCFFFYFYFVKSSLLNNAALKFWASHLFSSQTQQTCVPPDKCLSGKYNQIMAKMIRPLIHAHGIF